MAAVVMLVLSVAAVSGQLPPAAIDYPRHLCYLSKPLLQCLSTEQLDVMLDLLANSLEPRTLPSGETVAVSRLVAPTLLSVDSLCLQHTQVFWDSLPDGVLWAVKLFDATGKLPDGIFAGNVNAFGSWDECFNTQAVLNSTVYPALPKDGLSFRGRYVPVLMYPTPLAYSTSEEVDGNRCFGAIIIVPTLGLGTRVIGICVPSSCSSEDVRAGLQSMQGDNVTIVAHPSTTKTDSVNFSAGDIVVIVLMAFVGVLMVAGTAIDLHHRSMVRQSAKELYMTSVTASRNARLPAMLYITSPKPDKLEQRRPLLLPTSLQVLVAFSVYTNTIKLFDTTPGKDTLTCLHGIRFISMTWVLLGHSISVFFISNSNAMIALHWFKNPLFQPVVNAWPSVDTFILLSGILLAYGFCGMYEGTKRFNVIAFYVHRYFRLTPPLVIMLAISSSWFSHLGDGPLWHYAAPQRDICQNYWWRNLLYIQNFFKVDDMCLRQTWYLANDMQMFILSPLVLLPLVWRPLFGMICLCTITAAFLVLSVVIYDEKDFAPLTFILNPVLTDEEPGANYGYPWMRCTVWLVGIGLGYVLHRLRRRPVTLKPWLWLPAWLAAFAIGIAVVYGMAGYQMPWQPYSKGVVVAYGGLHRFALGVAVAWVIFACVTGYGGWINTFLSYPGFVPLSRLTYATYLVHLNVISVVDYTVKGTLSFDVVRVAYSIFGHVITSMAFALPLSLAFEVPVIALNKIMLAPRKGEINIPHAKATGDGLKWELREERVEKS